MAKGACVAKRGCAWQEGGVCGRGGGMHGR